MLNAKDWWNGYFPRAATDRPLVVEVYQMLGAPEEVVQETGRLVAHSYDGVKIFLDAEQTGTYALGIGGIRIVKNVALDRAQAVLNEILYCGKPMNAWQEAFLDLPSNPYEESATS